MFVGILISLFCLFVHRRYIDCPFLSSAIVDILIALVCLRPSERQKSAINIPAIDEETDKGNQYRITGNFCGVKFLRFWSKKKTFNVCGFLFLRIVNLRPFV
jgi:hypothetical protein